MVSAPPNVLSWFLLLLQLMTCCSSSAQTHRIVIGSSRTASDNKNAYWESPSGDFAFGFQQIAKDGFLLAIWFNKIPERTVVWSDNPNLLPKGSKVELNQYGQFILTDPTGKLVWSAGVFGAYYALMLDTGNLVLHNHDSVILWESFSKATDTLLPTQTLSQGMSLVSRYSDANYSSGRFMFKLENNGKLLLYTTNYPLRVTNYAYWESETVGSGYQLVFNQSGSIYLQAKNGTLFFLSSSVGINSLAQGFYQRAILESDGVFRHYVYPKSDEDPSSWGWNRAWSQTSTSIPPNICTSITEPTGSGACGFNSYCSIDNQRRNCYCPNGYTFIDPSDPMQGCKQSFEAQSCDRNAGKDDLFYLYSLEHTDWPLSDYEHYVDMDEDWCRKACLSDCFCAVLIIRDGQCWKKKIPLSNGRKDPNGMHGKALIKIRKDDGGSKKKDHNSTLVLVVSVLLSGSVFMNVLLVVASFFVAFHFNPTAYKLVQQNPVSSGINLQVFTYEELNKATNEFKEHLGSGAFADVYKGLLPFDENNGKLIAVKKLHNLVREGDKEFQTEVSAIGRTNHKNLVQLIGFCNKDQHRLLVYDFMSNGSVASLLFGPSSSRPNWYRRMAIAQGTARGLVYLHEECSTQIIHCDIKPQNILLDDYFTPRISDFGLAKLLKTDQTRTTTGIRGTKGYVAPEWFRNMLVTTKVDVYSYGIVLLELICGRKNFEAEAEDENQMILSDWAYDCYCDGRLDVLVKNDDEAMNDMKMVEKYVMVAIWCIQEDPSLRPTMKIVTQMLEGTIQVPIPPSPSSFTTSTSL